MRIKQQVTSLSISKKLKELGVPQYSTFIYFNESGIKGDAFWSLGFVEELKSHGVYPENKFSAFTVAELGELLPNTYLGDLVVTAPYKTLGGNWRVDLDDEGMLCAEKTEADARGKMLIYLIENNLLSANHDGL